MARPSPSLNEARERAHVVSDGAREISRMVRAGAASTGVLETLGVLSLAPLFAARPMLALAALTALACLRCAWVGDQCTSDPIVALLLAVPAWVLEEFVRSGARRLQHVVTEELQRAWQWLHVIIAAVACAFAVPLWLAQTATNGSVAFGFVVAFALIAGALAALFARGHVHVAQTLGDVVDVGIFGRIAARILTVAAVVVAALVPALGVIFAVLASFALLIVVVTARGLARRLGPRARPESATARAATATAAHFVPIVGPLVRRVLDVIARALEMRWRARRGSRTNAPCVSSDPASPPPA